MNEPLLWQGLELMLVGMGTVFVFLTLLVAATTAMSRLVLWLQARSGALSEGTGQVQGAPPADEERRREDVAAIAAALHRHRWRRRD